jgi:hypothetical protein
LAERRGHRQFFHDAETGDTGELHEIAAVSGLGELRDAAGASDLEQHRFVFGTRLGIVRLNHANQPLSRRKCMINHRDIARLENIERHLAAWQQQRAGQGKDRNDLG